MLLISLASEVAGCGANPRMLHWPVGSESARQLYGSWFKSNYDGLCVQLQSKPSASEQMFTI